MFCTLKSLIEYPDIYKVKCENKFWYTDVISTASISTSYEIGKKNQDIGIHYLFKIITSSLRISLLYKYENK